jgi:hypothetical protein
VPHAYGDSTTYVRGRARAGWRGDNRRCSSAPGNGRRDALRHSSQAGHKREQKSFCCVTTRPGLCPDVRPAPLPARPWVDPHKSFPHAAGLAAHAPLPHAPDELPAADAAVAAAWRPASGARVSGTPGLGSTADSSGGPGRRSDTLGAGRSAGRDAGRWSKRPDRDYAQDVPREGLLPKGPPERSAESLGHFFLMSSPPLDETTAALNLAGPCSPTYRRRRCTRPPARIRLGVIEITGKVHHADGTRRGGEGDKEGDGVDLHLRSKEGRRRRSKPSRAAY